MYTLWIIVPFTTTYQRPLTGTSQDVSVVCEKKLCEQMPLPLPGDHEPFHMLKPQIKRRPYWKQVSGPTNATGLAYFNTPS